MDNFYYDLLNIGQCNKNLEEEISNVIKEIQMEYSISNCTDGLCKVCSLLLQNKLHELKIESIVLNTQKLMGGGYEHEALLVRGKCNSEIIYYLIDLTFSQFLNNGGKLRKNFYKWPVDALLELGESYYEFVHDLLKKAFTIITPNQLTAYLSCINQTYFMDFVIEDLDTFFLEQKFRKI